MTLPQPSPRLPGDRSPEFIPLVTKESLGTGPANEMIARLAAAIAQEEDFGGRLVVGRPEEKRWPPVKTVAVLFVGCGLFWLLCYAVVVTFF
jgi:hypothetical protein